MDYFRRHQTVAATNVVTMAAVPVRVVAPQLPVDAAIASNARIANSSSAIYQSNAASVSTFIYV